MVKLFEEMEMQKTIEKKKEKIQTKINSIINGAQEKIKPLESQIEKLDALLAVLIEAAPTKLNVSLQGMTTPQGTITRNGADDAVFDGLETVSGEFQKTVEQ